MNYVPMSGSAVTLQQTLFMKKPFSAKVGDQFKMVRPFLDHGIVGAIYTVVKVVDNKVLFDRCECSYEEHRNDPSWLNLYVSEYFEKLSEITEEERQMAKPMPSVDEVASFLLRKP